jgi:LPXTG-site transpeptidase (sortase) family protein
VSDAVESTLRANRTAGRLRAASNVLLGVALGLVAYYGLTTLAGWLSQRTLRAEAEGSGPLVAASPDDFFRSGGPELDFSAWEEEDRAYWEALPGGGVFGRLVIERIGLDTIVVKGTSTADLKRGPGWIDWTELPGPSGTCGISGHRTTYLAPFRDLDRLAAGDTIELFSPYRRYRYRVTGSVVVRPDQTEVVDPGPRPALTLTACHPPYSARFRLAVMADLVEVRRASGE